MKKATKATKKATKRICRRVMALALAAVLLLGCLAGCGKETKLKNNQQNGGNNQTSKKLEINEPVTINILTQRHNDSTTDADDLWFFQYMEYWFAQQGYDVTLNVQQTNEASQQISLLLGTDSLPDLIWGIPLGATDTYRYGVEEGMILDWTPYLDTYMPNLKARFEELPETLATSKAPDDKLYALPYYTPSLLASGCYGTSERLYYRQSWLDACGVTNPTTQEEFLDVLRAFKNMKPESGETAIPLVSADNFLEKYLWTCLGFYGTEPNKYGSNLMIKDGEVVIPAYTDSYRDFVELMRTMYSENLIARDYFSMDAATAGGRMRDGTCGAMCYWTLEYVGDDFKDIVCANPILLGDNDEIHVSRLSYYTTSTCWASADTKYPELVAMLVDFIYSDEGAFIYRYGPEEGKDPLNLVDGWYYDDEGNITTRLVEDGTYGSISAYGRDVLFPYDNVGVRPNVTTTGTGETMEFIDSVTGGAYYVTDNAYIDPETNDGHWRSITIDKWSDVATSVRLPKGVYLEGDKQTECTDIITAIQDYISSETAKFITGQRSLDEIDSFQNELKKLGIETYLEAYREAYADYMKSIYD